MKYKLICVIVLVTLLISGFYSAPVLKAENYAADTQMPVNIAPAFRQQILFAPPALVQQNQQNKDQSLETLQKNISYFKYLVAKYGYTQVNLTQPPGWNETFLDDADTAMTPILPSHIFLANQLYPDSPSTERIVTQTKDKHKNSKQRYSEFLWLTYQHPTALWLNNMKSLHGENVMTRIEFGDLKHLRNTEEYKRFQIMKAMLSFHYDMSCLMLAFGAYLEDPRVSQQDKKEITKILVSMTPKYFIFPSLNTNFYGSTASRFRNPPLVNKSSKQVEDFNITENLTLAMPIRASNSLFAITGMYEFPVAEFTQNVGETAWLSIAAARIAMVTENLENELSKVFVEYSAIKAKNIQPWIAAYREEAVVLYQVVKKHQIAKANDLNFGALRMGPWKVNGNNMNCQDQWITCNSENNVDTIAQNNAIIYIATKEPRYQYLQEQAKKEKQDRLWWFANVAWDTKQQCFTRGFDSGSTDANGEHVKDSEFRAFDKDGNIIYVWNKRSLEENHDAGYTVPITYNESNKPCINGKEIARVSGFSATDANTWLLAALTSDDRKVLETMIRQRWGYANNFSLDSALFNYIQTKCKFTVMYNGKKVTGIGYHENDNKISPEWTYGWITALQQLSYNYEKEARNVKSSNPTLSKSYAQKSEAYSKWANFYILEMEKMRGKDGSMPYASEPNSYILHGWFTPAAYSSIIGPAWSIMVSAKQQSGRVGFNPFQPQGFELVSDQLKLSPVTDYCAYYANLAKKEKPVTPTRSTSVMQTQFFSEDLSGHTETKFSGENQWDPSNSQWLVSWSDFDEPQELQKGDILMIEAVNAPRDVTAAISLVDDCGRRVEFFPKEYRTKKEYQFTLREEPQETDDAWYNVTYVIKIPSDITVTRIAVHSGKKYFGYDLNDTNRKLSKIRDDSAAAPFILYRK